MANTFEDMVKGLANYQRFDESLYLYSKQFLTFVAEARHDEASAMIDQVLAAVQGADQSEPIPDIGPEDVDAQCIDSNL